MRTASVLAGVLGVGLGGASSVRAHAEEAPDTLGEVTPYVVPAPRGAFELGISGAYVQPFGELWDGSSIGNVVAAGGSVSVDAGYRLLPELSIGATALFHESSAATLMGVANTFRGATAGLQVTYHFIPYEVIDPWVAVSTGYRFLWSALRGAHNDRFTHGIQAFRILAGVDFRASEDVALGPFLGADCNVFLFDELDDREAVAITAPSVNTFITAGLLGRFDIGGSREPPPGYEVIEKQREARR